MFIRLLPALLLVVVSLPASACPLGAGESTLTLSRVMRNFGRHLLAADRATQKGQQGPQDITDAELSAAVVGIDIASSCASAVLSDSAGALNPPKASRLTGEELARYLKVYLTRMQEFLDAMQAYKAAFVDIEAKPVSERNFEIAKLRMQEVEDAANRAHEDLQ